MTMQQRGLIAFYTLVALAALVATWSQNMAYMGDGVVAASAFMVIEARWLGVRFVWLYILGGLLIAISFTFPLFMIARELRPSGHRQLTRMDSPWAPPIHRPARYRSCVC